MYRFYSKVNPKSNTRVAVVGDYSMLYDEWLKQNI